MQQVLRNEQDANDLQFFFNDMNFAREAAGSNRDDRTKELYYQGSKNIFERYAKGSSRGARRVLAGKRDAAQKRYDNEMKLMQAGRSRYADEDELMNSSVGQDLLNARNLTDAVEQTRKGKPYYTRASLRGF